MENDKFLNTHFAAVLNKISQILKKYDFNHIIQMINDTHQYFINNQSSLMRNLNLKLEQNAIDAFSSIKKMNSTK